MTFSKIIVANWKLERSFAQAKKWVEAHRSDLSDLASQVQLVVCPDIVTTASLGQLLQGTGVLLGAQDCSSYLSGKHTGAVSAQSLREAGCSYAIVGHSEERSTSKLAVSDYVRACVAALQSGISPILCLGEAADDRYNEQGIKDLFAAHLESLYKAVHGDKFKNSIVYIACEPLWAIGSPDSASLAEIGQRIEWLKAIVGSYNGSMPYIRLLYGGGITPEHGQSLGKIPHLDGLLLGSSSLDMQSLKKIVYSFIK